MGRPRKTGSPQTVRREEEANAGQQEPASNYITPDSSLHASQTGVDFDIFAEPIAVDSEISDLYDHDVAHGSEDFGRGLMSLDNVTSDLVAEGSTQQVYVDSFEFKTLDIE